MGKRHIGFDIWWPDQPESWGFLRRYLIPHPGTFIMTLLVVGGVLWAGSVGALPLRAPTAATNTSTGTIAYQGRLADSAGNPITATVNMEFRLYDVPTGGAPLWNELWTGANAVRVSDGLFNVMLGSLQAIDQNVIAGHDQLWLGITVGTDDEMTPRVQLGSVPFAVQALTVPDGSITTAKIAAGSVMADKLSDSLFILKSGSVPVTVSGSRPFYDFGTTTISFDQPFPNKTLFVNAHLNVNGTYIGVPIAQPWTWNREGFTISSFFYVDRDVTSASIGYTALGY